MSLTIEAECPVCSDPLNTEEERSFIDVVFDPAQEINELECPWCGALLQVAEYDAAAGTVTLIEVEEEEEEEEEPNEEDEAEPENIDDETHDEPRN